MKYGNSELKGKFLLGPMAGFTDIAFRLLCRRHGAAMCFTEFANAEGIIRNAEESFRLMQTCKEEMPVGIQIFGSHEHSMAKAAGMINGLAGEGKLFASSIDLNFGCPSGTVIRAGAGSALLKNPEKMASIARACADASSIPITAKIRAGWSSDNALTLATLLEKAGVEGITIHWRTATEGRKRKDNWGAIRDVKDAIGIPLIGNGGASTPQLAVRFLEETKCDAVMISSGALGNPQIFEGANALHGGHIPHTAIWEEKLASFREYVRLARQHGILSAKRLRLHAIEFVSGQKGVKDVRKRLNAAKSLEEIIATMESFTQ